MKSASTQVVQYKYIVMLVNTMATLYPSSCTNIT